MKILIAADMEGISGVVHWDQVTPGHAEYARFRRIMTQDVNAAIAGAQNAILDHTWSDMRVANLWLNGRLTGEIGLNAAVCGHFDAPAIMISGDQTACAEAVETLGAVEVAVVKHATGRMAAECLPPDAAQKKIREAASRAVNRLRMGRAASPYRLKSPITVAIEFAKSEMADRAMLLSGAPGRQARGTHDGRYAVGVPAFPCCGDVSERMSAEG